MVESDTYKIIIGILFLSTIFFGVLYLKNDNHGQECIEVNKGSCSEFITKCADEKALMEGVLGYWGENLYNSNEYLLLVDITNYGFSEAKNIEVICNIINVDENGFLISDKVLGSVSKNIGNMASTSYKQVELTLEKNNKMGSSPSALCFIKSCDNCEILYKRVPELVEGFKY